MLTVLTCIFVQHDLRLVFLAALICVVAACTAFGFHDRAMRAGGEFRWAWTALTGVVAASGVWATHFIAMLAYQPTLSIGYEFWGTTASLAAAVIGMGVAFAVPILSRARSVTWAGGALAGGSVAIMHYMGIAAVRTEAQFDWDPAFVVASILLGLVGGGVAFAIRGRWNGWLRWGAPSAAWVVAIVFLHFTAMAAVTLVPDASINLPGELVDRQALAFMTGVLVALILLAAFSLIGMERLANRGALGSLRDALDAVPSGLAFCDPADRLVIWNRAYAELADSFGLKPARGMQRRDILAGVRQAGDLEPVGETRSVEDFGRDDRVGEWRRSNGVWLRLEACPTSDGGLVTVLSDITAEKQSAAALAEARDAAEATSRAKSEFFANMSHEIRTPLNGVLGVAEVLARTPLSEQQQRLVGTIRESGTLLHSLLSDLLDLARVEAGMTQLRLETRRIGDIARSAGDLHAAAAQAKGLDLVVEVAAGAEVEAVVDPIRLSQVLGNLLSNAVKFTDQGTVTLSVSRHRDSFRFDVHDTGVGFDTDMKDEIFNRFGQADSSATRRHGGAGLGLSICQEYARLMGGDIDCVSQVGSGSTFSLVVPLQVCAEPEAPAAPAAGPDDRSGARVLIVDDNATNRQVLELILDSVGLEHVSAENGAEAVEAYCTHPFEVVLMDLQMPVMDGFEATRQIRKHEGERGLAPTTLIVVSANCLPEHVAAAAAAGADDHLAKPISAAQVIEAIVKPREKTSVAA